MYNTVDIYSYSDIGGRPENEDTCSLKAYNRIVAVLADGLGGEGGGKIASSIACNVLDQCGVNESDITEESIKQTFVKANEKICMKQTDSLQMKSTATYLHISDNHAIWGHIGDTRLYYLLNGEIKKYTLDHSMAQLAVIMGDIERKDICSYPKRSMLYRALGSDTVEDTSIDVDSIILEKGVNAFLICSDGLWEYLSDEEIAEVFNKTSESEEWAKMWVESLRKLRNERAGEDSDNNTAAAIIIEIK